MKVEWKSKILNLVQENKKDRTYQAFQDIHDGLNKVKSAVESTKINTSTPFGNADGTNAIFRADQEPAFMVVNGTVMINGTDFTYKNGYITFFTPPAPNAVIRSFHV